ncbi:hypothetical protein C1J01_08935 [Nonomuraea aridisoli]|uniref:Uncharacterized protein n=2 Tax=Nonomuraea aridisoli TaxID=2070368 RepID=A0A2W2E8K6_9ACTN|nr:hypothetical protein C1J01_08935 [Nonomuraea aridisoli]
MLVDEMERLLRAPLASGNADAWERGPDASHGFGDPSAPVECRVLLVVGEWAEVVTEHHGVGDDPLRVPAAGLADQLGVAVDALPGLRFSGVVGDDGLVTGVSLVS